MNKSKIEWTDATWNPATGCTKISAGCQNCYAERMSKRLAARFGYPADEPFRVTLHPDRLDEPLRWNKPRKIFVCSMGDLFHWDVGYSFAVRVWKTMAACPQHTFCILTKRPLSMEVMLDTQREQGACVLNNVWLGTSVENQEAADERIPHLLKTPAAVRFLSLEPLLGPVDLGAALSPCDGCGNQGSTLYIPEEAGASLCLDACTQNGDDGPVIDWVIVGAETGPGARPMDPDWARDIRDQCKAAELPFFFKKMSGGKPTPPDLMIQEYPTR